MVMVLGCGGAGVRLGGDGVRALGGAGVACAAGPGFGGFGPCGAGGWCPGGCGGLVLERLVAEGERVDDVEDALEDGPDEEGDLILDVGFPWLFAGIGKLAFEVGG